MPGPSPQCATRPTQADLLYPQISYIATNPDQGGHTAISVFGAPVPEAQQNYLDGKPKRWDQMAVTSEDTTNDCQPQPWQSPFLIDITARRGRFRRSLLVSSQGDFCQVVAIRRA